MFKEDVSNYYIKLGMGNKFSESISKLNYKNKELKIALRNLSIIRKRNVEIRAKIYENLISMRLNLDKFKNLLPNEEFKKLSENLKIIERFQKKKVDVSKSDIKEVKKNVKKSIKESKKEVKKVNIVSEEAEIRKKALDSERKELDLLKKDLERINEQLKNQ